MRDRLLAQSRDAMGSGPDLDEAAKLIVEIENAVNVAQSMKRGCTEARDKIDTVRASVETLETSIRDRLRDLRRRLGLA